MTGTIHDFMFSGYTLEEELYNNIMEYNKEETIKKMFLDGAYYICGEIRTSCIIEYKKIEILLEQLDNLDLSINEGKV